MAIPGITNGCVWKQDCVCGPGVVKRYVSKISGPLLDRIDLHSGLRIWRRRYTIGVWTGMDGQGELFSRKFLFRADFAQIFCADFTQIFTKQLLYGSK